jgi:uncharacterized protein YgiM (DUF1202 family)
MTQKLVNVSVANLYREPTFKSEITTQALLGEVVDVLDRSNGFLLVRLSDGYQSWIDDLLLCDTRLFPQQSAVIRSHSITIHSKPDLASQVIRDATIGRRLACLHQENGFLQVILPDGEIGWVEAKHCGSFPALSRKTVIGLAMEFLGRPYYWGGKTPKGLDCSGLTQLVFELLGRPIARDAWMQYRDSKFVSANFQDAQPADLLFFGKRSDSVDHVAIALGNGNIIHANGMVRINSLDPAHPAFNQRTAAKFLAVKTYF